MSYSRSLNPFELIICCIVFVVPSFMLLSKIITSPDFAVSKKFSSAFKTYTLESLSETGVGTQIIPIFVDWDFIDCTEGIKFPFSSDFDNNDFKLE